MISAYSLTLCVTADGVVDSASGASIPLVEYSLTELLGMSVRALFVEQQPLPFSFDAAPIKSWMRSRSGRHIDVEVIASELVSAAGTGWLLVINPHPAAALSTTGCTADLSLEKRQLAHEMFRSIYEHSAIGMAVCDLAGRYVSVNPAMCRFIGYSKDELLTLSYMDITHPEDIDTNLHLRDTLLDNTAASAQLEKRYVHKDGRIFWALMVISVVRDSRGNPVYTIGQMLNIDELKRTELALRESRQRLTNAQQLAQVGDLEWYVTEGRFYGSDEVLRILGITPTDAANFSLENFLAMVHPDDRLALQDAVANAIRAGQTYELNYRIIVGVCEKHIHSMGTVFFDAEGNVIRAVGTMQDITAQKQNEQTILEYQKKIQSFSLHSYQLVEAERKRIAQEIHDEIGQLLTVLKIDLKLCRALLNDNPLMQEKAEDMLGVIEQTITAARTITHNLRPPALNIGLLPAIEWLSQDIARRTGLKIYLDADAGVYRVDDDVATAIFRVIQQSMTNIVSHAQATEATITLRVHQGSLWLSVSDNGCGFDIDAARGAGGFGLFGMSERILALGGEFAIESAPGEGTTMDIEVPLRA